jgi:cyclase
MKRIRVIPVLLLDRDGGLVKTIKFDKRVYIGDPINAVRIFNDKEVDELVVLDIDASKDGREPNIKFIEDIVSEAFMPISYGGGIHSLAIMRQLYRAGVEKCVIRSAAKNNLKLIEEASAEIGKQSVVGCVDYYKRWNGKLTCVASAGNLNETPLELAQKLVDAGVGELIIQSVDRDGSYRGYDLGFLAKVTSQVNVPVVACGGAGELEDFYKAHAEAGCSAVAAGSMFVYQAQGRGVLISYPTPDVLYEKLFSRL